MLTRCRHGLLLALLVAPRVLALLLTIVGAAAFNGGSLMSDGDAAPQLHVLQERSWSTQAGSGSFCTRVTALAERIPVSGTRGSGTGRWTRLPLLL